MSTQKPVTTTILTQYDEELKIRRCCEPTPEVVEIYDGKIYGSTVFPEKTCHPPTGNPKNQCCE